MRKLLFFALLVVLLALQYPLWFGSGGLLAVWELRDANEAQSAENAQLKERNAALAADVDDLKQGIAAIEDRARTDLGMVKKGETYYQVIEKPASGSAAPASKP